MRSASTKRKSNSHISKHLAWCAPALMFLSLIQPAHAMHLSLVGVGDISKESYAPSSVSKSGVTLDFSSSSKLGFGGGALLGFGLMPFTELETGALYITRKYKTTLTAVGLSEEANFQQHAIQIPLLLRLHLTRYFSLGAGGYAAIGTGNVTEDSNGTFTNSGKAYTKSDTYSNIGLKNKDFGLLFSAGIRVPVAVMTGFIVDARYALGLTDVNNDPSSTSPAIVEKYRDVQILTGFQFGF